MTLTDDLRGVIALATTSAATTQASAYAATLTSTLGAIQQAESGLVEMAELLAAFHDDDGQTRAHAGSKAAREGVAALLKKRPADGRWQDVVLDSPEEVNELVRVLRDASGQFQREAIGAWQRVSERAVRQSSGSVAPLEALGGRFKQSAARAKQTQEDLRSTVQRIGSGTPTPDQATDVLHKSERASDALDEALSLIPDDAIRDGLTRAMGANGLPLSEAETLMAWIAEEGLQTSFNVRLS